jgi:hypothetical protein
MPSAAGCTCARQWCDRQWCKASPHSTLAERRLTAAAPGEQGGDPGWDRDTTATALAAASRHSGVKSAGIRRSGYVSGPCPRVGRRSHRDATLAAPHARAADQQPKEGMTNSNETGREAVQYGDQRVERGLPLPPCAAAILAAPGQHRREGGRRTGLTEQPEYRTTLVHAARTREPLPRSARGEDRYQEGP